MNKLNYIFTDIGTKKIAKRYPKTELIYSSVRTSVIMVLSQDAFDLDVTCPNFNYIVTAISNMLYYKLCLLARTRLNIEEETLLITFGKMLKKRKPEDMEEWDMQYFAKDFGGHIFYDITTNKSKLYYLKGIEFIPITLMKIVGQSSFGLSLSLPNKD